MTPQSRPSLEDLFHAALKLEGTRRQDYLIETCAGDEELLQRAEALLEAQSSSSDFLEAPLVTPAATTHVEPGMHIGPYKLLQEIGEGGMGVVYMAEQEQPVRRKVAVKVIKLGMDTKQVIARFEAERQALALMEHSNIARVLDAGATEAGRPYFVMELVRGVAINEYCDTHQLSTKERLQLFIDTCRAVQHAHQKGVIHRDIKPGNVLVTSHDGTPVVKIIDFGVAKATNQKLTEKTLFTEFKQFVGTPEYMSPEQAEMSGLDVDTRTDIYSLGVLFYQLLVGSTPFDGKVLRSAGYGEMTRMIREDEPQTPSTRLSRPGDPLAALARSRAAEPSALVNLMRGDLDWIVMKSISKDRTRRYDSASELADDVVRHLRNEPVLASPPSAIYRTRKLVQRNRGLVAACALATLGILVGLGLALGGYFAAKAEAERSGKISAALTEMLAVIGSEDGLELEVREILATAREAFGDDNTTVAATLSAMAGQLRNANDLEGAEKLYREALGIFRATYGDEHPSVGRTLGSLGIVQSLAGSTEGARSSLTESLRIEELHPESATPFGCSTRRELAQILGNLGQYSAADVLYQEALAILRSDTKPRHMQVVTVLEQRLLLALADPAKIDLEPIYREMIEATHLAFPPGHLTQASSLYGLGVYLTNHKRGAEAIPVLREAIATLKAMDDPHTVYLFGALDLLYQALSAAGPTDDWQEADLVLLEFMRNAPALWDKDETRFGMNLSAATEIFYKHEHYSMALETGLGYMQYVQRNDDQAAQAGTADQISGLIWDVIIKAASTPEDHEAALQILHSFPSHGDYGMRVKILRAALNLQLGQASALTSALDAIGTPPETTDPLTLHYWNAAVELNATDPNGRD